MPIAYEVWLQSFTIDKFGDVPEREINILASMFKPRPGLTTISSGRTVSIAQGILTTYDTYLSEADEDPRTALLFYDVFWPGSPITIHVLTSFSGDGIGDSLVKVLGGLAGAALSGPFGIVAGVFLDPAVERLTKHDEENKSIGRAELALPTLRAGASQQLTFNLTAPKGLVLAPRRIGPPERFGNDRSVTPAIVLRKDAPNGTVTLLVKAIQV